MAHYSNTESLNWKWVGISVLVLLAAQGLVNMIFVLFGLMTLGFGFLLFMFVKPLAYYLGGYLTGRLSPGLTIREPAIGAVIVALLSVWSDGGLFLGGNLLWAVVSSAIAYFCALAGARAGERL